MRQEVSWVPSPLRSQEQGELLAEVRRRDGDACRVCAAVVHTGDRRSTYALNYRILDPGTTLTMHGVVVVCRQHMAEGDILPAPAVPYYTEKTLAWLDDANQASEAAALAPGKISEGLFPGDLSDGHCCARRDVEPVRATITVDELHGVGLSLLVSFRKPALDLLSKNSRDRVGLTVEIDLGHSTSPSVGAPFGAGCDKPQPTEGDLNRGGVAS